MKPQKYILSAITMMLLMTLFLAACGAPSDTVVVSKATSTPNPTPQPPAKILTVFYAQSPTVLNSHLSRNIKDIEPSRIVYEPLAVFNKDGLLVPILASEVPSLENGGVAKDGKSVTWKLRQDVKWSDGTPFTAVDVVFTFEFVKNPDVKAGTASTYNQIASVTAPDDYTVRVDFIDINPSWYLPFVGNLGVILPKHVFEPYNGTNAREAPANTMPVGTGAYRITEDGIKPQEVLLLGSQIVKTTKTVFEPNPYYRFPEKIAFDRIIWRGGGLATEAARLSLQEGKVDVAYDLDTVNPDELSALLESSEKGRLEVVFGTGVERILINRTDPNTPSASDEYSSLEVPHPLFDNKLVRQAIAHAINREAISALYGANGTPTHVNLVAPPQFRSTNEFYEYNLEKAKALLDEAGYLDTDGDGFREKDGIKIKMVLQSQEGTIPQASQLIIQKDLKAIGIDLVLKTTASTIFFGSGATNPDADTRFNADMMMFRVRSSSPDPSSYMRYWTCTEIPQKSNNWTGGNDERWCNPAYDTLLQKAKQELDTEKRQAMFIELNDMLVEDVVLIPVVWRAVALGVNKQLIGLDPTPWDSITWNIQDWYFITP